MDVALFNLETLNVILQNKELSQMDRFSFIWTLSFIFFLHLTHAKICSYNKSLQHMITDIYNNLSFTVQ